MDIDFNISTRGRKLGARWYPRPDRISIFVNKISGNHNPNKDFKGFIAEFCALEFHELAHIYGYRGGCQPAKDCSTKCYFCRLTDTMFIWFEHGIWPNKYLNFGMKEL
jgi:hypothetical protein